MTRRTLTIALITGIIGTVFCLAALGNALAQQSTPFKDWPSLDNKAAWAQIETRRQARLEMVSGVDAFNAAQYQKAVQHFEKFVAVFPNDSQGKEYLGLARKWAAKTK